MRSLTPAEARVVGALLDTGAMTNQERIARTRIPPRTFETASQRLLTAGIVYDRYVPNPTRFRFPAVGFALARPFVERAADVERRWAGFPGNVVLWRSPDWIFGVFFRSLAPSASSLAEVLVRPGESSRAFCLEVDARDPQVPVYFDFEGAWAALTATAPSAGYPRPLPGAGEPLGGPPGSRSPDADRVVGWTLARRPVTLDNGAAGPRRRSPRFFPRPERRALSRGWVEHRVFLDVTRIPATPGGSVAGVAWVLGRLRTGRTPERLFAALRGRGRLAPFLFATDERQVVVGALARAEAHTGSSDPGGAEGTAAHGILPEYLEEIELARSPLAAVTAVRDHRYDLLLGGPGDEGGATGSTPPG